VFSSSESSVEYRLFTRGFRHAIDTTLSASAVLLTHSLLVSGINTYVRLDIGLSIVLLVMGLVAELPVWLVIVSSIPVSLVHGIVGMEGFWVLELIVLLRGLRTLWDLKWFASRASTLGRELTVLAAQTSIMAGVMLFGGSISLWVVERGYPGSHINSLWDALWATIVTTTTVGYGDIVPVSPAGRMITALMMIFGVGLIMFLLSNVTGIIAKITIHEEDLEHLPPVQRQLKQVLKELEHLEEMDDEEYKRAIATLDMIRLVMQAENPEYYKIKIVEVEKDYYSSATGEDCVLGMACSET
jgi:hypothetical protein